MNPPNGLLKFLTGSIAAALGCFALQAFAYFVLHGGAGKTESNYFSTLGRFQGSCAPGAEIACSGSSISGRLPGRESGNRSVANLGSDGGSPYDGLKLIAEGVVSPPKWLVLETNTLFNGIGYPEVPAVKSARGFWFAFGGRLPLLGAAARPSGMLYARLLRRNWNGDTEPFELKVRPQLVQSRDPVKFDFTSEEMERVKSLEAALSTVRNSGVRILLARYPAGEMKPREIERMNATIALLSAAVDAPYLDLEAAIPRESLVFTDPVHLGPASAARVLETLRAACRSLETTHPSTIE